MHTGTDARQGAALAQVDDVLTGRTEAARDLTRAQQRRLQSSQWSETQQTQDNAFALPCRLRTPGRVARPGCVRPQSHDAAMTTLSHVLARHDTAAGIEPGTAVATGLRSFDAATGGGMWPGTLWVVTGQPGAGRSILAAQLARTAATEGHHTRLVLGREDELSVVHLLLAAHARVPLHRLRSGQLHPADPERLAEASRELGELPLLIDAVTPGADRPSPEQVLTGPPPRLLVIDDVDLWAASDVLSVLRRLRALARHARTSVVVTAPETVVARDGSVDHTWSRYADYVLRLSRPDLVTLASGRSGEIDMTLSRGQYSEPLPYVCFQGHYARIVDPNPASDGDAQAAYSISGHDDTGAP